MDKFNYKRIIGLFIFALTIMAFSVLTVNAETCDETVKRLNDNDTALARYALSMTYDSSLGKYVIKSEFDNEGTGSFLRSYDSSFKASKIKFKIAGLYFYTPGTKEQEKNDLRNVNPATVEDVSSRIDEYKSSGAISKLSLVSRDQITISQISSSDPNKFGIAVKLVPDGFNDPELVGACGPNASFYVVVYTALETGQQMEAHAETVSYTQMDAASYGKIDCNNYQSKFDKNSFNYKFCEDKVASVGADGTEKKNGTRKFTIKTYTKGNMIKYEDNSNDKVYKPGEALPFKCDYNDLVVGVSDNDSEYYVNKKYLYGTGTIKINLDGGYQYTSDSNNKYSVDKSVLNASCELKCEEVVKVEYGPPIASKAGLCFEYKVKVTSRVNCEMVTPPNEPPKQVVCTPTPWCNHPGGYADHQGGPNDDFDECVMSCDGGIYSDRCVNKCYKDVYGVSVVRQTTGTEIVYEEKVHQSLDILYEYKYKGNTLIWDVGANGSSIARKKANGSKVTISGGPRQRGFAATVVPTDSYWHKHNYWGFRGSVYTLYDKTGIPLIAHCSTTKCWWALNTSADCKNEKNLRYLNAKEVYTDRPDKVDYSGQSDIEQDAEFNKKQYEELVKQCSAYASCNTTTAEFTISVDYTEKGSTTKKTIYFPYTENNDPKTKDSITNNDTSALCPTANNSIILSSDGCYNCSKTNEKRHYMTEWSFPGTWIHNKTGKISYNPSSATTTAWRKIENKFCLPLNIDNTNAKWYNYYQAKLNGDDTSYSYNNPEYITNATCPDGRKLTNVCQYNNTKFTEDDAKNIDYNINATARKFGMYEWDIDISCFYAVNDLFPREKETDNCSLLTCSDEEKMRIRTVDLNNLFPDKEGNKLTDSSTTGRNPGFNWTSYANQTEKDTDFKSTPSNYAKWIQAKGTSVYSDEYLDYEVNLTKEAINEIKKEFSSGMNKQYTNWEGEVEINSVTNYQSPLFRNGGILSKNSKYPTGNAITCNNMKNYRSTECEDFSEEGK